jgi:hypothetical protein
MITNNITGNLTFNTNAKERKMRKYKKYNKTTSSVSGHRCRGILFGLATIGLLTAGLSGCGQDNPLQKADIATLHKGYVQLKDSDRDCIDNIAARSPNSGYQASKALEQQCKSRYSVIAHTFSKVIGKPVSVNDVQAPEVWLDFFKRDDHYRKTLK